MKLSWDDNSGNGSALATDKAMVVIYHVDKNEVIFTMDAGQRGDVQAELNVPANYSGTEVQIFITFVALDSLIGNGGKNAISNSSYAGNVTVA